MATVNRFKYEGIAVGGPYKGAKMMRVGDPVWPLARMARMTLKMGPDGVPTFEEDARGRYDWDSGIWWWRGWE
jgi:hypothetical protein